MIEGKSRGSVGRRGRRGGILPLTIIDGVFLVLLAGCVFGVCYLGAAAYAVRRFVTGPTPHHAERGPAVTVLKPLCGDEPDLYENLRSFCEQTYPDYQVVFGVATACDPAATIVRRLMRDLPGIDLTLVVCDGVEGSNLKVAKLERMIREARHQLLVLADSDIRVGPDYLARVVAPLSDPAVGLVTCLFTGSPAAGFWSRLGAMGMHHGFLPSVLFSRLIGLHKGCFGASMVLRREMLDRIGGFASIRDQLADDHALGAAVSKAGGRVVISPYVVASSVAEADLESLFLRELRWGRTIRSVAPVGHAASIVTHPVALAVFALALPGYRVAALVMLAVALAVRLWMTRRIDRALELPPTPFRLVPLRDLLSLAVFVTSLWGSRVVWRQRNLRVTAGGRLVTDHGSPPG